MYPSRFSLVGTLFTSSSLSRRLLCSRSFESSAFELSRHCLLSRSFESSAFKLSTSRSRSLILHKSTHCLKVLSDIVIVLSLSKRIVFPETILKCFAIFSSLQFFVIYLLAGIGGRGGRKTTSFSPYPPNIFTLRNLLGAVPWPVCAVCIGSPLPQLGVPHICQ